MTDENMTNKWETELKKYIDDYMKSPALIMAPCGSSDNAFRLYAYGGDIGRLPVSEDAFYALAGDSEYAKYLSRPYYSNGHGHRYDFPSELDTTLPRDYMEKYKTGSEMELFEYFAGLNKFNVQGKSEEDIDKWQATVKDALVGEGKAYYLPVMMAATKNRWTKKGKKHNGEKAERWRQQEIAKIYQQKSGKLGDRRIIITDVEFDMPISAARSVQKSYRTDREGRVSKPDFIMFDGERFGYVEFKYMGDSMEEYSTNALDWHFLDFYSAIVEADASERLEKYMMCLDRLDVLLKYGVIKDEDGSINKASKDCRTKAEKYTGEEELFFSGFLFLGNKAEVKKQVRHQLLGDVSDKRSIANSSKLSEAAMKKRQAKKEIEDSIAADVKAKMDRIREGKVKMQLYCQYEDDKDDFVLDLSKDLWQFYKAL